MKHSTPCHDGKIREHICSFNLPQRLTEGYLRESGESLPTVIYPEIRVITADKITQNKTFYPAENLKKGLITFSRPYPIPVIQDHNTGGGFFGGEASPVYGRIEKRPQLVTESNATFVKAIARITEASAIEAVMTGRWLTVSLGSRTESVTCSICGTDLTEEWCDHIRGEMYEVDGSKKKQMAYWIIGPMTAKELSFVISPSDDEAGVLNPDTAAQRESGSGSGRQECGAGAVTRVIVGNEKGLFDLVTGVSLQESYYTPSVNPLAEVGNFRFLGW